MTSKVLSREEFLGIDDVQYKDVAIPEWGNGHVVRLRTLTAAAALDFAESSKEDKASAIRLIIASAVNEGGDPLFTGADVERLRKMSMKIVLRLQNAAMVLNGLKEGEDASTKND